MASISGIDQITVILGLGTVTILYTMLGGLRATMPGISLTESAIKFLASVVPSPS